MITFLQVWKKSQLWTKKEEVKNGSVENGYKLIKNVHKKKSIENIGKYDVIHIRCGKKLKNLSTTFPQNVDKFLRERLLWKLWINLCRSSVENVDEAILQKLLDLMGKSAYN